MSALQPLARSGGTSYRERIWPGAAAVAAAIGLAGSLAIAYRAAYGGTIGWLTFACALLACALLALPASTRIELADGVLRVGRAAIETPLLADSAVINRGKLAEIRRDPSFTSAYWAVPPWVRTAVAVAVNDPEDPHPMWIIGTRRARELQAALASTSV